MNDEDELQVLIQRYADGIADENQVHELQTRLRSDAQARKLFRSYMQLDAALANLGDAATICDLEPTSIQRGAEATQHSDVGVELQKTRRSRGARRLTSAMACIVACILIAVIGLWRANHRPETWGTLTQVGQGVSIWRGDSARSARTGDLLRADEQIIVSRDGIAQVTVAGLGVLSLGPDAQLQGGVESRLIELKAGFAAITAEKQLTGQPWRIRTPQVEAAVLGTKFNIASAKGRTAMRVSEGIVKLTSRRGGQSERVHGGNRAIVSAGKAFDIATSRPGSVLLLTSREPPNARWHQFNQILIDKLVHARMWRLGFQVELEHYETATAIDLSNRSLVVLSLFDFGVGESVIQRLKLAESDLPILCLEPAAYPALGMTVDGNGVGFGFRDGATPVEFTRASHPLAVGYAGSHQGFIIDQVGWGRPVNGAVRIAHVSGNPDESVLFGYDTGQPMTASPAPARRVGLFLDPTGISEDTPHVWAIFEAAVDWCVATGVTL